MMGEFLTVMNTADCHPSNLIFLFKSGKSNLIHKDGWLFKFVELAQNPAASSINDVKPPFDRYAVGKCEYFPSCTCSPCRSVF